MSDISDVVHDERMHFIWVLEDDTGTSELVSDILAPLGYIVGTYRPPLEFRGLRFANGPSCVVMDQMLEGPLAGTEMARALRDVTHLTCPLIAMSGSRQMLALAEESGLFVETVLKPFNIDEIVLKVRAAIVGAERDHAASSLP